MMRFQQFASLSIPVATVIGERPCIVSVPFFLNLVFVVYLFIVLYRTHDCYLIMDVTVLHKVIF